MVRFVIFSLLVLVSFSSMAKFKDYKLSELSRLICKKDKSCSRFLKRHLIRDLKRCQISPSLVEQLPVVLDENSLYETNIRGRVAYLSFVPAKYKYKVNLTENGEIDVIASVYFKNSSNFSQEILEKMQVRLNEAAQIWENHLPYQYKVNFKFFVTTYSPEASVKVKLVKKPTRGPYFSKWSTLWKSNTVAHEMGHILGLDDEYHNFIFKGVFSCNKKSLMCMNGNPLPYHYYVFLRRALCRI